MPVSPGRSLDRARSPPPARLAECRPAACPRCVDEIAAGSKRAQQHGMVGRHGPSIMGQVRPRGPCQPGRFLLLRRLPGKTCPSRPPVNPQARRATRATAAPPVCRNRFLLVVSRPITMIWKKPADRVLEVGVGIVENRAVPPGPWRFDHLPFAAPRNASTLAVGADLHDIRAAHGHPLARPDGRSSTVQTFAVEQD